MIGFVVRRLLRSGAVLLGISLLVFGIFFLTPGVDPAARLAGRGAAPEVIAQLRHEYGFDRPVAVQYGTIMRRLFWTGDLPSFVNRGQRVVPAVLAAAPVTLALAGGACVLWLCAGLLIALVASGAGPAVAGAVVAAGLLGVSVPAFWLAEMVDAVAEGPLRGTLFAWVPPPGLPPRGVGGWVATLALPCVTLAVLYAGIYGRVLSAALRTALAQDYCRTARAKGLGTLRVSLRHALPNAANTALAQQGLDLGALLGGGTLLVEVVFGLHGIGRLTYDALQDLDLAATMACVLYSTVLVLLMNLLVEVAQALLDPMSRG